MIFGFFEDPIIDSKVPTLTPGVRQGTEEAYQRGIASTPESEYESTNRGVEATGAQMLTSPDSMQMRNNSMGLMVPDSIVKAISDRATRGHASDVNAIQRQAKLAAPERVAAKQNIAAKALENQRSYELEVYKQQMAKYQAEVAARNSAISGILGAGGSILGGVIGRG